jgi:release factor glutamine methyltransferase
MAGARADLVVSVTIRPMPWAARLIGKAMALGYRLTGKARYDDFRIERVQGGHFIVLPSVFNPRVPRTGEFLASMINRDRVPADAEVLDMGTGSGVGAITAAHYAGRVVAVDINPQAVRCASINALVNHVEDKVEVRHGDLFAPVRSERFDLVLFNPPFLRGTPRNDRDRAWRSRDVAKGFATGLHAHLKPKGCAWVLLSSFGDAAHFIDEFHKAGLRVAVLAERRFVNERLTILQVSPSDLEEQL